MASEEKNNDSGLARLGLRLSDWFEKWFQPEKVSAFVAYLCHESVECSGEAFRLAKRAAYRIA